MNHPIPTPLRTEDVTPEWLSQVLDMPIGHNNFVVTPNVHGGSGFLSNLIRVACQTEDGKKELKIIVKLLPLEKIQRHLVQSEKFDVTEINFYLKVIPDMCEELPELKEYFCTHLYGHIQKENKDLNLEYASVLILEDLQPPKYYTIDFSGEETPEQILYGVEFLAKLHMAGMAVVERKKTTFPELYPFLQNLEDSSDSVFYEMCKNGFAAFDAELAKANVPEARAAYQALSVYSDQIIDVVTSKSKDFACLIHGDLWSNNIMFSNQPDQPSKIIDWQLAGYNDPATDLAVLIISSLPTDQLTSENVEKYLKIYFDTYARYCRETGWGEKLILRDFEDFSKYFYTYAMSYTFLWCAMATEPFSKNYPRLVHIYDFLHSSMRVPDFLMKLINKQKNVA